jgi:hypothetical protein
MGLLDTLRQLLRREAADARAWAEESVSDGHASLDRAERRLSADPQERMAATLADVEDNDAAFEALRQRADAATARPAADAELADAEGAAEPVVDDRQAPPT